MRREMRWHTRGLSQSGGVSLGTGIGDVYTMLVKQEQVSPCEVELQVEIDVEKVNSVVDATYTELAKVTSVPGFRKGKAPRIVLEQYLDRDKVKNRAADKLVQGAYTEALDETKIEPFAPADVELVSFDIGEPLVFKARVPLPPTVELGEYVGLEAERNVPPVEDEHIEAEINRIRERRAEYIQTTDRPAQQGDSLLVEMLNANEPEAEPKRNVVEVGKNLPSFDQGLVGMSVDEEKAIEVTYPEDYDAEELRGTTVPIRVKLLEINEKKLPELTDEWVKQAFVGEEEEGAEPKPDAVDTVEKLRAKMRETLERAAQDVADSQVRDRLVGMVIENSKVCFPGVMIEEAVDERLEGLLQELKARKVTLDDYLDYIGSSLDDLRAEYEEESRRMLTMTLVFREIRDKENIEVSDGEVEAEIGDMAEERGVPVETMTAYVERTDGASMIRNRVLRKKIVDFLVHASNIKNVGRQ